MSNVSELVGKTLLSVEQGEDELVFRCTDGTVYRMWHWQDCCEQVEIKDICGDLDDLIGHPILLAEERSNEDADNYSVNEEGAESATWTFYEFRTIAGSVTISWLGVSNGYYSEAVDFEEIKCDLHQTRSAGLP